jgi:hypothetical protein
MKRSSSGAFALLAFLIGCATGPTYENYTGQDAACVDGDTAANFTRYWSEGEAHVFILEIDGVRKKPREPVCLPPGKHDLKIRTAAANAILDHYLDFHFQAGRKYALRANYRENAFVVEVMDITAAPGTRVGTFRSPAKAGSSSK